MPTIAKVGFVITIGWIYGVMAFDSYNAMIPNGGNVVRNGLPWPGVGHTVESGGPSSKNPFGEDFASAGYFWSEALCRKDSDGDGQSNGLELGDPDCQWTMDDLPVRADDISHPGFADSRTQAIPTTTQEGATATTITTETTTATSVTTTETTTTIAAQVQGNLILNVSNSSTSVEDSSLAESILLAAIAEIAGVDINAVVVTLAAARRLQANTLEPGILTVAYSIIVSTTEAASVVQRITSVNLASATAVVIRHFSDAGFDVIVEAIGLFAKIAEEAEKDVRDGLASPSALLIGAGIGAICFLVVALCSCGFYRYQFRSSNKGAKQNEVPNPDMASPKMLNEEPELV